MKFIFYYLVLCFLLPVQSSARLNEHVSMDECGKSIIEDSIKTITTYYYDYPVHNYPTRVEVNRSNGITETVLTTYPTDYGVVGNDFIYRMTTDNVIIPVEKVVYQSVGGTVSIISGEITTYHMQYAGLPVKSYQLELNTPLPVASFKLSNRNVGEQYPSGASMAFSMDTKYKEQIAYDSYDANKNIQEYHKANNNHEVILWGYSNQYPVAKIIGSTYSIVQPLVNQSILNNPVSDQQLRDELNALRANLSASGAVITSYTYKPLIGMTSETDAAGHTTYYEYDSLGRLIRIKDHNGKILKQYDYQYQVPVQQ